MAKHKMEHIIVVLPGILGSVLAKDGKDVWALSSGAILKGLLSLGGSARALAVVDDDPGADDLGDGITAPRLMPDVHLVPRLWKIDGYSRIVRIVRDEFDAEPGVNFFEFPYDWRRDNRATARLLRRETARWLSDWRDGSGNPNAKIIFLAHSMGGLVARQFIEGEEDGLADTEMLFTFGTPYAGSLNALDFLANGFSKGLGPIKLIDLSEVLRSMTSVYQLLPTYPCYDPGDGQLVRVGEVEGIPNVDAVRAAEALSFHHEITDRASTHIDTYPIRPIVGINQPTLQGARFDGDDGVILEGHLADEDLAGDGTVPRPSATPVEWETEEQRPVFFSSEKHASLQNSSAVLTQIRGALTGSYDKATYRAATDLELSMEMPDWVEPGSGAELRLEARPIFDKESSTTVQIAIENCAAPFREGAETAGTNLLRASRPPRGDLPNWGEGGLRGGNATR